MMLWVSNISFNRGGRGRGHEGRPDGGLRDSVLFSAHSEPEPSGQAGIRAPAVPRSGDWSDGPVSLVPV